MDETAEQIPCGSCEQGHWELCSFKELESQMPALSKELIPGEYWILPSRDPESTTADCQHWSSYNEVDRGAAVTFSETKGKAPLVQVRGGVECADPIPALCCPFGSRVSIADAGIHDAAKADAWEVSSSGSSGAGSSSGAHPTSSSGGGVTRIPDEPGLTWSDVWPWLRWVLLLGAIVGSVSWLRFRSPRPDLRASVRQSPGVFEVRPRDPVRLRIRVHVAIGGPHHVAVSWSRREVARSEGGGNHDEPR